MAAAEQMMHSNITTGGGTPAFNAVLAGHDATLGFDVVGKFTAQHADQAEYQAVHNALGQDNGAFIQ